MLGPAYFQLGVLFTGLGFNEPKFGAVDAEALLNSIEAFETAIQLFGSGGLANAFLYTRIGFSYEVLASAADNIEEVGTYLSAALSPYSLGTRSSSSNLYPDAFAARGKLWAQLCRSSDAERDLRTAIDLARNRGSLDAVARYEEAIRSITWDCKPSWADVMP